MEKLTEIIDTFITKVAPVTRDGTMHFYKSMYWYLLKMFKYFKIETVEELKKVKTIEIAVFYRETTKLKFSSIKRLLKALKRMLAFSNIEYSIDKNFTFPNDGAHYEVASRDDVEKVIKYLGEIDSRNKLFYLNIIILLFNTGLRITELLELKISDIDIQNRIVKPSHTKCHEARTTMISQKYVNVIADNINRINGRSDKVVYNFFKKRDGSYEDVRYMFKTIRRELKIPKFHAHMIRKCFATILYNETKDILLVSKFLGHKDTKMTLIYIGLSTDYMRSSYDNAFD